MSLQSAARKHPILVGVISAVGFAVFVPLLMSIQGVPVGALLLDDNLPKFLGFCVGMGALMTLMAYAARLLTR